MNRIKEVLEEIPDTKYTLSNKLWDFLKTMQQNEKTKVNIFGLGVNSRVGLSVKALIPQHNGCGVAMASSGRLLTTHIPNVTKQRLSLQSLTQLNHIIKDRAKI